MAVFGHISAKNFFFDMRHLLFRFKPFPEKTNANFFQKVSKTSFLATFWPKSGRNIFFFENPALSLFFTYFFLIIPRKSEKTNVGKYHNFKRTNGRTATRREGGRDFFTAEAPLKLRIATCLNALVSASEFQRNLTKNFNL